MTLKQVSPTEVKVTGILNESLYEDFYMASEESKCKHVSTNYLTQATVTGTKAQVEKFIELLTA